MEQYISQGKSKCYLMLTRTSFAYLARYYHLNWPKVKYYLLWHYAKDQLLKKLNLIWTVASNYQPKAIKIKGIIPALTIMCISYMALQPSLLQGNKNLHKSFYNDKRHKLYLWPPKQIIPGNLWFRSRISIAQWFFVSTISLCIFDKSAAAINRCFS